MSAYRALLGAELRIFVRDKASLAFTFLFPLLFILIFGALMGGIGDAEDSRIGLAVAPNEEGRQLEQIVSETGRLSVHSHPDRTALEAALETGDVDFGAVWDGDRLTFLYDARRTQENHTFEEVARGIAARFNLLLQGLAPIVSTRVESVGGRGATGWLNLVVPGILAFSTLSAGLFAVSGHITGMKQRKLLDRMIVTPMPRVALLAAVISVRLAVVYVSTLITLGVAIAVFRLDFDVDWLRYSLFVPAGTVGMMGFGTVIALVVRQPSSAGNIANAISMIMMFVSGIYFPIEIMPAFLRGISRAMPLTYMADALRYATGVIDMSDTRFWWTTGILFGAGVAVLPLLARYVVRADRR